MACLTIGTAPVAYGYTLQKSLGVMAGIATAMNDIVQRINGDTGGGACGIGMAG